MKLNYLEILEKNKIDINSLPDDIKIGIKSIKGQERAINMREKGGKVVGESQLNKISREDKIVCNDLNAWLKENKKPEGSTEKTEEQKAKEQKEAEAKAKAEKEAKEKKEKEDEEKKEDAADPVGLSIEEEFTAVNKEGVSEMTIDELKSKCPLAYSHVFNAYNKDEDNGVCTSKFELLETEKGSQKFKLNKI